MVLGADVLYVPDNHPLLCQINNSITIQGQVVTSSSGPALTHLESTIHMANDEANTLVLSLMTVRAESPILEGASGPVVLPDN